MNETRDLSILDKHIVGRVTPHIYAFSTGTVPSYLKVGDTYRPVATRLSEWSRLYPDLESHFQAPATLGPKQDAYFRDYSVHKYLEAHHHSRLQPDDVRNGVYYSREFFRGATHSDVEHAIKDILASYEANDARYTVYDATSSLPQPHTYARSDTEWILRPNQQQAVSNFQKAVANGRTNLLMYAVMRFGKSFTSLACAQTIGAKSIAVVSAKADVLTEWKKTTEIPANFDGYRFLTTTELENDSQAIANTISNREVPVVFLTLQDLQGDSIKKRHNQVFDNNFDLLIIDESHYGARAQSFGQVLRDSGLPEESKRNRDKELADIIDPDEADKVVKTLTSKVRLHLSGTPYRILMGSEFSPEDIIAFVQFSDIVQEQEAWDREHLNEDGTNEWDNPYFGFPQMVRFAFDLNESSRERISKLRSQGISASLSALLQPQSVTKDARYGKHKKFKYEKEVLDLLRIIDGSQNDPNILGFLDYDKIKEGHMCRHMVMVLPYKASCDAMEALITEKSGEFKNLSEYKILNISGLTSKKAFTNAEAVKTEITNAETDAQKTITLTVNKMLTGSTVEQWDTMLFLKDTSSPQEYDQAIFRLQNQYVREFEAREGQYSGGTRTIRHCLKPQTLLVDFDPIRMFRLQEQKSLIYNVNTDGRGNDELESRLKEELRISPIITLNNNLITEVEPTDILKTIGAYNANRTIIDEVMDLPVDLGILNDPGLRALIESQEEIGSRNGLTIKPTKGEGDEADAPPAGSGAPQDSEEEPKGGENPGSDRNSSSKDDVVSLEKKIRTYYQRVLFFALLSRKPVASIRDIVAVADFGDHPEMLENLDIRVEELCRFRSLTDPYTLGQFEYKIQNINQLARDTAIEPLDRAERALRKFNRISEAEIRTPSWLCTDLVRRLPPDRLRKQVSEGKKILDIASSFGEFSIALYRYLTGESVGLSPQSAAASIYAIPTSKIAYELTRRVYELAGLNPSNVAGKFTSYDLWHYVEEHEMNGGAARTILSVDSSLVSITLDNNERQEGNVRFGAVVGNPPYGVKDGGAGSSSRPIYQHFVKISDAIADEFVSLVVPARWYAGGKGLESFREYMLTSANLREFVDQLKPEDVFPDTNNRGGICHFLLDKGHTNSMDKNVRFTTMVGAQVQHSTIRQMDPLGAGVLIRNNLSLSIIKKVLSSSGFEGLNVHTSAAKAFGFRTYFIKDERFRSSQEGLRQPVLCYGRGGKRGWVEASEVTVNRKWLNRWKVFIPESNNIGTELADDNQNAIVGGPRTICTETYLVCGADLVTSRSEAEALCKFLRTKFARFLHAQAKTSQHGTKKTYRFVPVLDFKSNSTINWGEPLSKIDHQLFRHFDLTDDEIDLIQSSVQALD